MNANSILKNPFVGLRPFESEDSLYYFGRTEHSKALLQVLHQSRLLAVVGSSGSGKSSLVRAGLIPNLEAGFLVQDRDRWHIAKMKPGDQPLVHLSASLLNAIDDSASDQSIESFSEAMRKQGVHAVLDKLHPLLSDAESNLLLLVDQFGEVFRLCTHTTDRSKQGVAAEFVAILLRLAEQAELPVYVCLTMRSDYLGDCDTFPGLPEAVNRSQYLLPWLTRWQRREAIEGPIRLFGATTAGPLAERKR
ncbi:hypothetical protein JXJ21_12165 [candidate division KSB1 bacterium]|nr:hypothetical protein [candidate division KSB1 bacterium]